MIATPDTPDYTAYSLVSQIKDRVNIQRMMQEFCGIKIDRPYGRYQINIRCPFHDDKDPSFTVYFENHPNPKYRNTWKCQRGCGGNKPLKDQINFYAEAKGISLNEAISLLANELNLLGALTREQRQTLLERQYERERLAEEKAEIEWRLKQNFHELFYWERLMESVEDYLRHKQRFTAAELEVYSYVLHEKPYISHLADCYCYGTYDLEQLKQLNDSIEGALW